jgi:hypothetical protein
VRWPSGKAFIAKTVDTVHKRRVWRSRRAEEQCWPMWNEVRSDRELLSLNDRLE